jgi:hypothetical protein
MPKPKFTLIQGGNKPKPTHAKIAKKVATGSTGPGNNLLKALEQAAGAPRQELGGYSVARTARLVSEAVKKREADAKRKEESAKRQARRAAYKAGRAARIEANSRLYEGTVKPAAKHNLDLAAVKDRARFMTDSELADAMADAAEGIIVSKAEGAAFTKIYEAESKARAGGGGGGRGSGGGSSGGQPRHPAGGPKGGQFAPKR